MSFYSNLTRTRSLPLDDLILDHDGGKMYTK